MASTIFIKIITPATVLLSALLASHSSSSGSLLTCQTHYGSIESHGCTDGFPCIRGNNLPWVNRPKKQQRFKISGKPSCGKTVNLGV